MLSLWMVLPIQHQVILIRCFGFIFEILIKVSVSYHRTNRINFITSMAGLLVVFSLLPNRRAATYVEIFERLKQEAIKINKTFNPKKIVSDFESSLLSAVRTAASPFCF